MCAYTLSHPHHPSPHTNILASLVKGEVLSPEKIRATTGGIAAPTLTIPTAFLKEHPSLAPHHVLASLVKGEVLSLEKIRATTGGIVLRSHNPSKTTPPLAPHHHTWLPCQRELDCDKAISYYKLQHSAISSTLISSLPYLSQD
jgi:hypothetical protein